MEWCFYQWVVSFSFISAGNWATSDLEIDRSVSAPGPEPVSQCESVSDFPKWYDGTVRSNHLKLGIKFLNHRWIIILSICTTNPRLNERYTTTVPVRQKINHSLHSPKEIGAIHWKSIFKNLLSQFQTACFWKMSPMDSHFKEFCFLYCGHCLFS